MSSLGAHFIWCCFTCWSINKETEPDLIIVQPNYIPIIILELNVRSWIIPLLLPSNLHQPSCEPALLRKKKKKLIALFIHISFRISLAPWKVLSSRIKSLIHFPLQVVMKGDQAAIHRNKSEQKKGRGWGAGVAGGREHTQMSHERSGECVPGQCCMLDFHNVNQSLQSHPSTYTSMFFLKVDTFGTKPQG